MFNNSNDIDSFVDGIQRVKMANDDREFQRVVHGLCEYMKQQMPPASWQRLVQRIINNWLLIIRCTRQ